MRYQHAIDDLQKGYPSKAEKLVRTVRPKTLPERNQIFNIGVLAGKAQNYPLSRDAYKKILAYNELDRDAINNLAVIYIEWSRYREAIELLKPVIYKFRDLAILRSNLAVCHLRLGEHQQAVDLLQELIREFPDQVRNYELLATTLCEAGHEEDAMTVFRLALDKNPTHLPTYLNLAKLLRSHKHYEQALALVNFALKLDSKNRDGLLLAGMILKDLENNEAARLHFEQALKLYPSSTVAASALASIYIDEGNIENANKVYQGIEIGDDVGVHGILVRSRLKEAQLSENEVEILKELLAGGEVAREKESEICFSLSNYYDRNKNYKEDIEYLRRANEIRNEKSTYKYGTYRINAKGIRKNFCAEVIRKEDYNYDNNQEPIFIIGMPRSGSTLTEQIISSHPQVTGYGEMDCMTRAVRKSRGEEMLYKDDPEIFERLRKMYRDITVEYNSMMEEQLGPLPARFTDKQLFNFQYVGLIKGAFPKSSIIHCMRHPVDNCIGIYRQLFQLGQIEFAYSFKNIAEVYIAYTKLMTHWREIMPGAFLDVQYEETVNNTEGKAREIIDFCNLEWDDACLKFYESDRKVKTASNIQVRQPVYKTAVAKWKNYEPYVQDLIGYLQDGGVEIW